MLMYVYKSATTGQIQEWSNPRNFKSSKWEFLGTYEKQIDKPKKVVVKKGWVLRQIIHEENPENSQYAPITYEIEE